MKLCPICKQSNNDSANFCSHCGARFPQNQIFKDEPDSGAFKRDPVLFWVTLFGSLALSAVLIFVFHLPVFVMGLFLPLIWKLRQ